MNSGIYIIENKINRCKYIGQSVNVKHRIELHKCDLKHNRHSNLHLQSSYNKYGESNFKFKVIWYCDITLLDYLEKSYIQLYESNIRGKGYNIECGGNLGREIPIEARKRMSISAKGKIISKKTREIWSKNRTGKGNSRARKVICVATGEIWNTAKEVANKKGLKYSTLINKLRGKDRNDTTLKYVIEKSDSKRKLPVIDISTNKIWDDYADAAKELNLNPGTLRKWLQGQRINNTNLRLVS